MSATNFKTDNNTYRKLIGNGLTYRIPRFQRDYSWSEEHWEDLWADLVDTMKPGGEVAHYMGYLVLKSENEKTFDVIDGQQRLTTLALLVLAVLKHLRALVDAGVSPNENEQRLAQIRQTYIGFLDPVTLLTRSKLTLNRNDDSYFQKYLVPLEKPRQRRLRVSQHLLRRGFEWFENRVKDHVRAIAAADQGRALAQFVEDMSDHLFFTVINVTDELNAYRVFETLNARGVELSSTDLLKNHLFSVLDGGAQNEDELQRLEEDWEGLVGRLEREKFPEFLRVHWLSRGRFVRHSDLFKAVRKEVSNKASVFQLLRDLDADLDLYLALIRPENSLLSSDAKRSAGVLKLFGVKQPYPALVAAQRVFSSPDLETMLNACVVLALRYNVIGGLSPGEQEPVFASVAQKITSGEYASAAEAIRGLASLYPTDDAFEAAFVEKTFSKGKERIVRYLLCELEKQTSQTALSETDDLLTVEHVLPQSPGDAWPQFATDELDSMTFRLANLVLMHRSPNRRAGNKSWAEKRPLLLQSNIGLTRQLAEQNAEWTPTQLMARQRALAHLAKSVWKVSQLS